MSKIGAYLRKRRHVEFLEKRVTELGNKIYQDACLHGTVDVQTRQFFLKYNQRLKEFVENEG